MRAGGSRFVLAVLGLGALGCSLLLDPQLSETGDGAFGVVCGEGYECESGLCRDSRCTVACSTDACPNDATCADGFCVPVSPPPIDPLQVGMLYVGPVGDHGWTKAHDDSRAYVLDRIDGATAMFAPSVSVPDAPARIDDFVARGDNVIIGTSYDFLVPMQSAALRYPDVNFLLCSGFVSGPNLGSYFGRMYQVMYQAGRLAGLMTETDRVGVVGPVVIPETVRHLNAFTQGVRSVNPDARVLIRWVFAWFDPDLETVAANELVDAGVDVLFGHTDTTVPIETANARSTEADPVYTIGYDNPDSCDFAPETCLTSAYWNWGPMVTRLLLEMREGTWRPDLLKWEPMLADPHESTVYLAPISDELVPSAIRLEVEGLVDDLSETTEEGRYLPFVGPVRDNTGAERIADGALPTDRDLLSMCWFVEGVFDRSGEPAVVPPGCVGDR